jgi:NAD(P)-dependent dehydrogenase (short-subunit alcohol dehydrogenase family)
MSDSGKPVAIVTGGSRGIGRATAELLARADWRVVVISRNPMIEPIPGAVSIVADVSRPGAPETIVQKTLDQLGRIDALVNNAGSAPLLSIEATTPEVWRETIETNLTAPFLLSRACWPTFLRQGGGVIVNVSSAAARDPFAGFFAYGAAKAGLNNLGLSLARSGAAKNIRVHTIAPGATETEMFRNLPGTESFPRDQTLDPADVARVIVQCIRGDLAHTAGEIIYLHKGA